MSSVDERLSTLEANDKAFFHQVDDLKEEVRDIRRLTIAVVYEITKGVLL